MIELGKINSLKITNILETGVFLDAGEFGVITLPYKELKGEYKKGGLIDIFLYKNSAGKIVATTQKPKACVGEFAYLKVVEVASVGAFLDWGMPKDLFVAFNNQVERMIEGESYIVRLYYDNKSDRVAAASKFNKFLISENIPYSYNQEADLLICEETELGYNAIIDNGYRGLLYKEEVFQKLKIGQQLKGYIKKIREDGKIDLSLQKQGYRKPESLSDKILAHMKANGGISEITDKSGPEIIADTFGVSKKQYKMAVGLLYKERKISIEEGKLKITDKS